MASNALRRSISVATAIPLKGDSYDNVRIHYTPTYSSWLNQIEIWFSKVQRQAIARGIFSSVDDLARKIMRFIRNYNKTATPIRWRYADEKQRISCAI
jgi:hypothetical protein